MAVDAGRAQERRADGVSCGARSCLGETSIVAPSGWAGGLVGRGLVGQGARTCPAGDRSAGQDRGLDCRRHRLRQTCAWKRAPPHPLEWLLIEWPEGEKEATKYWLSTLPEDTPIDVLVDTAKLRWRIERDYEELKSELGLAHFEGRSWRGFHHHATLCIAAYGFLIRERAAIPPSGSWRRETSRLSSRPKLRGAADPTRAAYRKLNRDHPPTAHSRPGPNPHALPMLPSNATKTTLPGIFVTQ